MNNVIGGERRKVKKKTDDSGFGGTQKEDRLMSNSENFLRGVAKRTRIDGLTREEGMAINRKT